MLTLTASILETVIIRTSVFAGQQILNVAYYGGVSLYNWYNPTLTETELLQRQVKMLQNEIDDLKELQYKNVTDRIIAFNNIDDINDEETSKEEDKTSEEEETGKERN